MRHILVLSAFIAIQAAAVGFVPLEVFAQENVCAETQKELDRQLRQLTDYADSLKSFVDSEDLQVVEILSHKIADLIQDIKRSKETLGECPTQRKHRQATAGASPARSEQDLYADKNCEELRTMLFHNLRRVSVLKRRDESVFSKLSSEEQAQLQEGLQALKDIRTVLNKKCSDNLPPARPPRRRVPRRKPKPLKKPPDRQAHVSQPPSQTASFCATTNRSS
jgi:hypothetical protein